MILRISSALSCAFQVHHRRSELEADLDTQEDGENETLSEKSMGVLPMVEDSVRGTFDKIIKQKQKERMPIAEDKSSIYDALLEQNIEVILTSHPTKVN